MPSSEIKPRIFDILADKLEVAHATSGTAHADIRQIIDELIPDKTGKDGMYLAASGTQLAFVESIPSYVSSTGEYLTNNGERLVWNNALPIQGTANAGKYLVTDGNSPSWISIEPEEAQNYIISVTTASEDVVTIALPTGAHYTSGMNQLEVFLDGATLSPTFYEEETSTSGIQCDKVKIKTPLKSGSELFVRINTKSYMGKAVTVGNATLQWRVNTVVGTTEYVLPEPALPSNNANDYNVFFGAGKLKTEDFLIHQNSNSIEMVDTPLSSSELCVQFNGQKIIKASNVTSVVKDVASTSVTVAVNENTSYIYGTLTDLTINFNEGSDDAEFHMMFTSGTSATTLTLGTSNALYSSFSPSANAVVEVSGKYYIDKWLVLFSQIMLP